MSLVRDDTNKYSQLSPSFGTVTVSSFCRTPHNLGMLVQDMCRTPTVLIFRYKMCSTMVKIRQKWIGFLYRYIICCPQKRFKLRIPFTLGIKAIRSWTCFVRSLYISFYQVCLDGRNIYKEPKVTQWYNRVNTICKKSTKSETLFLIGMAFEKVLSEKRMGRCWCSGSLKIFLEKKQEHFQMMWPTA